MRDLKNTGFNDRLSAQKDAKQALLARFKPKPTVQDPEFEKLAEKRAAEKEAIRQQHELAKAEARREKAEKEAARLAAEMAAQEEVDAAKRAARKERKQLTKEEQKAARDARYAAEVVEQFMQCMSVYPIGSLVELSTGEVAIVMAQNAARRLQPRVMVLTAPDKRVLQQFNSLDLMVRAHSDDPVRILAPLPPGAHGLDDAAELVAGDRGEGVGGDGLEVAFAMHRVDGVEADRAGADQHLTGADRGGGDVGEGHGLTAAVGLEDECSHDAEPRRAAPECRALFAVVDHAGRARRPPA